MAAKKTTSANAASSVTAFLKGRDLAVQLMRDLKDEGVDACCIERRTESTYLLGEQSSTLANYLAQIAQQPELVRGFAAVLTDLLGTDAPLEIDCLESLTAEAMGVAESTDGHGFAHFVERAIGHQA